MSQPQQTLSSDWPDCPYCQVQMIFASVMIHDDDHDLRTFECKMCEHLEKVVIVAKRSEQK